MNGVRLLTFLSLWLGLGAVVPAQAVAPAVPFESDLVTLSCESAEQLDYTIGRITTPGLRQGIVVPARTGDRLVARQLNLSREAIASQLAERQNEGAYRFRFLVVTVSCLHPNSSNRVIDVEFRTDDVGIPQGDSAGSVIDEANTDRLDVLRDMSTGGARWDRVARLGDVLGFSAQVRPDSGAELPSIAGVNVERFNVAFDGWKALDSPFYSFRVSSGLISGLGTTGFYRLGDFGAWAETLPLADGTVSSWGARFGSGWEWQYGRADLHIQAAYSISRVHFDAPLASPASFWRNAIELSAGQEFLGHGRFARVGGWFDTGGGTRSGAFTRVYQDLALAQAVSSNVDVVVAYGYAGASVDPDRRFVGGSRLDPFLAEKGSNPEELAWTGPILRGHGISDFYVPRESYATDDHSAYAGFSLTWGVPGWRRPVIEAIDVGQSGIVRDAVQKEYDLAVVALIQENIRRGMSGERARARSELEARELRQALHNLMVHAHRTIVSPILTFDGGWLTDHGFRRNAIDGGAGVRIQRPRLSIEILYAKPLRDSVIGYPRSGQWLVRFSARAGFMAS